MEWTVMEWVEIEWSRMGWDWLGCGGMGWDGIVARNCGMKSKKSGVFVELVLEAAAVLLNVILVQTTLPWCGSLYALENA